MIGIGDDVIISGRVVAISSTYYGATRKTINTCDVVLNSGERITVNEDDIQYSMKGEYTLSISVNTQNR